MKAGEAQLKVMIYYIIYKLITGIMAGILGRKVQAKLAEGLSKKSHCEYFYNLYYIYNLDFSVRFNLNEQPEFLRYLIDLNLL